MQMVHQFSSGVQQQLTQALLPADEKPFDSPESPHQPNQWAHECLSRLLCLSKEKVQKLTRVHGVLVLLSTCALGWFLLHWFVINSANEHPTEEWLNGAAALSTGVIGLVFLRKELSDAVELQTALRETQEAQARSDEVQAQLGAQMERLQTHLASAKEEATRAEAARRREQEMVAKLEHNLSMLTNAREMMGDDMESWFGTLDGKLGELTHQTAQLGRITWMQVKNELLRTGQLDRATGVLTNEGLETLRFTVGESMDLAPMLERRDDSGELKLLSDESGLRLFTAKEQRAARLRPALPALPAPPAPPMAGNPAVEGLSEDGAVPRRMN